MVEKLKFRSVSLKGILYFLENSEYAFNGPLRKGLRPIVWHTKPEGEATSSALISESEINEGESKEIELFILNELQLNCPIKKGVVLSVGTIVQSEIKKFGEFKVLEHLGEWHGGKVP